MVKPVRNNMKQNINSQHYKNLRMNIMMSKHFSIQYMIMNKYYTNNRRTKSNNFLKIKWQVLYYHILKKLWISLYYKWTPIKKEKFIIWILIQCIFIIQIIKNIYRMLKTVYAGVKQITEKVRLLYMLGL